jgi:phosphoribosylformylglycinamidine cyclo-ligase
MELYLDEKLAQDVIDIANGYGIDAQVIGHVEAAERASVTIKSKAGTFEYRK